MKTIDELVKKMEQVWPGELGDDIDIKEIEKDLKGLKALMPLLQGMQAQPMTGNDGEDYFLIQIPVAVPIKAREFEVIKEFLLQNAGYERPTAETVE